MIWMQVMHRQPERPHGLLVGPDTIHGPCCMGKTL